ncbi:MAG TPA: class I SAM-dependent methyltransferase [Saprospiraceae bacterium]|nr:class I SAM-dependent methyltransferase [Saprospiraceae bacterium]HMQ83248.1 class I SAM-dependent methyltransferase [Saprospiraceae bacterium]
MKKIYTTFSFFKQSIAASLLILMILAFIDAYLGYRVFLHGLTLLILVFVLLIFRIVQLNYKYQLDRVHDTNQMESTMWLYAQFKPSVALPAMRDVAGSPDFLKVLVEQVYLHQPKVIVEAGSGVSSIILSEALMALQMNCDHYALDHLEKYADLTREKVKNLRSQVWFTPLKSYAIMGKDWLWYDTDLLDRIPSIDMLVIDGPPENIQPMARYPALPLLISKLSPNAVIILDDTNRPDEQQIIRRWQEEYSLEAKFLYTEKGTCVLSRKTNGNQLTQKN